MLRRPCLSLFALQHNCKIHITAAAADVFSFSPKVLREKESVREILFLSIQANKQKVFIIVLVGCALVARRAVQRRQHYSQKRERGQTRVFISFLHERKPI